MDTATHRPPTSAPSPDSPSPAALTDTPAWQHLGGADTAAEIAQQPALWEELARTLPQMRGALHDFLGDALEDPAQRVLFTGAGSSGFIAELAADALATRWPAEIRAVHTTNLLTHPAHYLQAERPTVLVSFGRSGSSPESVAVIEQVRASVTNAKFVNITCNAEGELARRGAGRADTLTLLMPAASCDKGFAMTSSLSCMLLAALGVFDRTPDSAERLRALAALARQALAQWAAPVAALAQQPFERVIYLGSGPLEALAREAALKLLELTAGRVSVLANTPLGFRHGPKSALNANTLLVMLRSAQPLARRYEQDVLDELRRDNIAGRVLSIGPDAEGADDVALPVPALDDPWLAPVWLVFAQLYALHRSAALGLTPDNPFPDGTVNRIVQGVTIYHE